MTLDIDDKKYITEEINRSRVQFRDEMIPFFEEQTRQHLSHMTALQEGFEDSIRGLAELIQDRPTRNEVREMFKGETDPLEWLSL